MVPSWSVALSSMCSTIPETIGRHRSPRSTEARCRHVFTPWATSCVLTMQILSDAQALHVEDDPSRLASGPWGPLLQSCGRATICWSYRDQCATWTCAAPLWWLLAKITLWGLWRPCLFGRVLQPMYYCRGPIGHVLTVWTASCVLAVRAASHVKVHWSTSLVLTMHPILCTLTVYGSIILAKLTTKLITKNMD